MSRGPDFIIIGAMKCGTSSLHEQLALRPGLFLSTPKEPCFFSDDEQYARGWDYYQSLFQDAQPRQLCGESSTHYTKLPTHPHAVSRMRVHLPDVKLIYLMRHPIERMISQYIHEWTQKEVRGSIDAAIHTHERYVAYSCYARQLEPYLEAYGASRILPIFFERMRAYGDQELGRVCRFIGDASAEPPRWDRERGVRNVSSERMRVSRARERLLGVPGVEALKARLPRSLRNRVKGLWQMRRRPPLSAELRQELEQRVDADLKRLGDWLGTTLTCRDWRDQVVSRPLEWADAAGAAR